MDPKNCDQEDKVQRSICKDEDDDSNSSNEEKRSKKLDGIYDPSKFECPDAPIQVKNLFVFITHYSPQMIEIVPRLKSFIPDYIPTVGHVDAFIKIPYPDNRISELGLKKLDEPNVNQTDPNLLQLKLKALSKKIGYYEKLKLNKTPASTEWINNPVVPLIQTTGSLIKDIDKWVENIEQLHETTARPESVSLLHQQPDHENINNLMQEWAEELETTLNVHSIPTPELDCSLEEYINIVSAILDIPIQNNKIASLHLIFSLLNEFQNSQHFNKYEQN